jgi:hypothetical protein
LPSITDIISKPVRSKKGQQQTCQVPNQHKGRSDRRRHAPVAPTATSALLHR